MSFESIIADDVAKVFLNDTEFAEAAIYKPYAGDERQIAVVVTDRSVNREQPQGVRVNEQH